MIKKVLNEKILVRVASEEEVSKGGIILTPAKQERKYEGTVVDVGTSEDIAASGVKAGDYVYYPKGLNTELVMNEDGVDVTYDVVSIYDVLAVREE